MKIYLLETEPESTRSDFYFDFEDWARRGVSLVGNRHFCEHKSAEYEEAENIYKYYNEDFYCYYNEDKSEFIKDYFPTLAKEDAEKIIAIFEKGEYFYNIADDVLSISKREKYISVCLCGNCQSDWIRAILPEEEAKNARYFETMYFNTGIEYCIREAEDGETVTPENFFDGETYGEYFTEWDEDEQKKQIAEQYGISPEDVKIFKIAGSYTAYRYAEA